MLRILSQLQVTFVTDANGIMTCVEDQKADQFDIDKKKLELERQNNGRANKARMSRTKVKGSQKGKK